MNLYLKENTMCTLYENKFATAAKSKNRKKHTHKIYKKI